MLQAPHGYFLHEVNTTALSGVTNQTVGLQLAPRPCTCFCDFSDSDLKKFF